jgi:hypothetical protein
MITGRFVSDMRQIVHFSLGTPVFSTNKTDHYDITKIFLKVLIIQKIIQTLFHQNGYG